MALAHWQRSETEHVVDPTTASVELAANMRDMVDEIIADELPATRHLEMV